MTNRSLVKIFLAGLVLMGSSGYIEGYNGGKDALSTLLGFCGQACLCVAQVWGMIRLWNSEKKQPEVKQP